MRLNAITKEKRVEKARAVQLLKTPTEVVTCKGDQEGVTQQGRRKTKRGLSPGSPDQKVNQDGGSGDLNDRVNSDLDQGRLHGVLGSEEAECNGFTRKWEKRNWKKHR